MTLEYRDKLLEEAEVTGPDEFMGRTLYRVSVWGDLQPYHRKWIETWLRNRLKELQNGPI
jgi:hypothetical protein